MKWFTIAESEPHLQKLLNITGGWWNKMRLRINCVKTEVIHFRKRSQALTTFTFCFGPTTWSITKTYNYLGFTVDEYLTFEEGIKVQSDSVGRARGSVINIVKYCCDLGYRVYTELYRSSIRLRCRSLGLLRTTLQ